MGNGPPWQANMKVHTCPSSSALTECAWPLGLASNCSVTCEVGAVPFHPVPRPRVRAHGQGRGERPTRSRQHRRLALRLWFPAPFAGRGGGLACLAASGGHSTARASHVDHASPRCTLAGQRDAPRAPQAPQAPHTPHTHGAWCRNTTPRTAVAELARAAKARRQKRRAMLIWFLASSFRYFGSDYQPLLFLMIIFAPSRSPANRRTRARTTRLIRTHHPHAPHPPTQL